MGNSNTGHNNSGHYNSGRWNSGNRNSGFFNSGNNNSGNCNSGSYNSGWYNSGNFNSGFLNSDTPTVRCFNKETGIKREDFPFPSLVGFKLTEYIDGKLVIYKYKEAWAKFWNQLDDDRKSQFTNLPNFDPEIFEEITGIKTKNTESLESKKARLKYLIKEAEKRDIEIQELKLELL